LRAIAIATCCCSTKALIYSVVSVDVELTDAELTDAGTKALSRSIPGVMILAGDT